MIVATGHCLIIDKRIDDCFFGGFAANKRRISNFDTSYVGNRVKFSRLALKRNPKIASANNFIFNDRCGWQLLVRFACGRFEHAYEHEHEASESVASHEQNVQRSSLNENQDNSSIPCSCSLVSIRG